MRVGPTLEEVLNGDRGMLRGIEVAVEAQCLVSAVALMFSTIDALAALTRPVEAADTSRDHFIAWTSQYLHPEGRLGCSAKDLYSARCGVLHGYTGDSRMVRNGEARSLVYEWAGGPAADKSVPLPEGALVIEVEALQSSVRKACAEFLVAAGADADIRARVEHHMAGLLCYSPWPRMHAVSAA